jgi:hypothetical protein
LPTPGSGAAADELIGLLIREGAEQAEHERPA